MNLLSLGSVVNIYDQRRENVNCLHISTYRQLAAIPEVQESRPGVLLELSLFNQLFYLLI